MIEMMKNRTKRGRTVKKKKKRKEKRGTRRKRRKEMETEGGFGFGVFDGERVCLRTVQKSSLI